MTTIPQTSQILEAYNRVMENKASTPQDVAIAFYCMKNLCTKEGFFSNRVDELLLPCGITFTELDNDVQVLNDYLILRMLGNLKRLFELRSDQRSKQSDSGQSNLGADRDKDLDQWDSDCNSIGIELANSLSPQVRRTLCAPRITMANYCQSVLLSESRATDINARLYEELCMRVKIFTIIRVSYSSLDWSEINRDIIGDGIDNLTWDHNITQKCLSDIESNLHLQIRKTIKGSSTEFISSKPCAENTKSWNKSSYSIGDLLSDCIAEMTYHSIVADTDTDSDTGPIRINTANYTEIQSETHSECFIDMTQFHKSIFIRQKDHLARLQKDLNKINDSLRTPHMTPIRSIYLVSDNNTMVGCTHFHT